MPLLPRWTAFAWLKFWGGMSLRLEVTLPGIRSSILPSPTNILGVVSCHKERM